MKSENVRKKAMNYRRTRFRLIQVNVIFSNMFLSPLPFYRAKCRIPIFQHRRQV